MPSSEINAFIEAVEAINECQLLPSEIHDAYSNDFGYIDCKQLSQLEYFAQQVDELVALSYQRRSEQ